MKSLLVVASLSLLLLPAAVQAQPYVAVSLGADIARRGTTDDVDRPGSGEALSFSLRTGASVTPTFGVELDFTRASELETTETPDVRILSSLMGGAAMPALEGLIFPPITGYQVHTEERTTTITASAWARQEISPRFSLVYLGGIAFGRIDRTVTTEWNFGFARPAIYAPTYQIETVDYTPGPMAGIEGRLALTEHANLVPGVRLLSLGDGWIMRPAIGLNWTF